MKRGWLSRGRAVAEASWGGGCSHLSMASSGEDQVGGRTRPVVQLSRGLSGSQTRCGTYRSEGFSLGEHVPDRFGEFAGDLDAGDFGASLSAEADLGALVVIDVGGMAGGVHSGFDQRPAQVFGAVLGQFPAPVLTAGLVHPGTEPAVAAQLLG